MPSLRIIAKSGRQNVKLKSVIHNCYNAVYDIYLKTRHNTLPLLIQYSNPNTSIPSEFMGVSLSQQTDYGRNASTYDKAYWKDKECYNFHKKIHPSSHCPNKNKNKYGDYDKYKYSKEIKSSIKDLSKDMKSSKKTFTNL